MAIGIAMLTILTAFCPIGRASKVEAASDIPVVSYEAHVQNIGWQQTACDGQVIGTAGCSLRVEALKIRVTNPDGVDGGISYKAHVQDYGWMPPVSDGALAGTEGQSKRVEAFSIYLTGELGDLYDIYYKVHVQDIGWMNWCKNGQIAGTEGQSKRIEAMQIVCVAKGSGAPTIGTDTAVRGPSLSYQSHVENIGWQSPVPEGSVSGTSGQGLRVEAFKINFDPGTIAKSGFIEYSAHVQDIGWQDNPGNGGIAGTEGQSKRVEAIKIKLTGDIANYYDVYYRVHIQNYGWLGWAKDGQIAGSTGIGARIEAYEIKLVAKGNAAPGGGISYYTLDMVGGYTIKVNKQACCITVYAGNIPIKAMICSPGTATPVGTFSTGNKMRWGSLIHNVYGQYCTRIYKDFLFHSVPYAKTNNKSLYPSLYNRLGTQASAGCVRLTTADAKWLYDNCPSGTTVVIYESPDPGPLGKPGAAKLPGSQTWDPTDPNL